MAITIGDLRRNPRLFDELRPPPALCSCGCGRPFDAIEDIDEKFFGPTGRVRADCHYARLGKVIEQHPIVSGGIRRG